MKGQTYVILAIVCMIIISVFAVLNMSVVEVNYLFWKGSSPLIFVILFSVLSGGVLTMLFGMKKIIQLRREKRRLSDQVRQLQVDESELSNDTPRIEPSEQTGKDQERKQEKNE